MRIIPEELAAHLSGEATTLCRCWKVTRRDETIMGFTDHDNDLSFDGVVFHAATGMDAADASSQLGLATGGGEVAGALCADGLNEQALAKGLWDCSRVEIFLVNWREPAQRIRLWVGETGEVKRQGAAFTTELRGLMHRLNAKIGRLFAAGCDACLGDSRCGVDIAASVYQGSGIVSAVQDNFTFIVEGISDFDDGWFTQGVLTWATGANTSLACNVREHRKNGSSTLISLWQAVPDNIAAGDGFAISAGCDRQFETCRIKFANAARFRGFPHMPGTEKVLGYPSASDGEHNGLSIFN